MESSETAQLASAREVGHLVRRDVQAIRLSLGDVLIAIPMVHVKVQYCHATHTMGSLCVRNAYQHIVQEAKPHRLVSLRMVARGARHDEGPLRPSLA